MDIAVRYRNQGEGFGVNVFTGEDVFYTRRFTARSRIKLELSDVSTLTIGGDYSRQSGTVGTNVSPSVGYETLFVDGAVRRRGDFYTGDYAYTAKFEPFWM